MIQSYGMTDVGRKRSVNEDSLARDDAYGIYIVSDGMGGHQAGEIASELAVNTIRDYITQYKNGKRSEKAFPGGYDSSLSEPANVVRNGMKLANKVVFHMSQRKTNCKGMGATGVVLSVLEDRIIMANVGDSRAYLIRANSVECLSYDHTLAYEQLRENLIGEDEVAKSPYRSVLTRAIGVDEDVEPDVFELQALSDDRFLLCSDGLTNMIDESEILEIITRQKTPEKICRRLVGVANKNGGLDNITAVLLHFNNSRSYRLRSFFHKLFKAVTGISLRGGSSWQNVS